ncbi:double zinc ribbon domain-containing protein [Haloarchaeobius amylolyticus]|uniref:double zinc ribbon domain-containing protein n=1 Tax=Haloarchaeobius amylolyticus TaxID=1198296 RepID=UPI00226EB658|nr:zinc ribbon domain-containing protein [Haloarchaeobius amylolyticus]
MTVHCPFCQDDIEPNDGDPFCPDCGNPIPELRDQADSEEGSDDSPPAGHPAGDVDDPVDEPEVDDKNDEENRPADDGPADKAVCPSCDEPVEPDWAACPYCTADLSQDEPEALDACPNCDYEGIDERMSICPQCQQSLPGGAGSDSSEDDGAHPADTPDKPSVGDTVYLDFERAGTMEAKDGTSLGSEIRQHLNDHGVSTNDAMRISRQHLLFKKSGGHFQVVDLESANGTELNGDTMDPNREYELDEGDELVLAGTGEATVRFG